MDFTVAEDVEVVSLPAGQRVERTLEPDEGGCLDVVVSVSPPSAGISYRLIEGGEVIRGGRAERVVGDQICGSKGPVTLSLSLATGGEALLLTRPR